MLAETIRFSEKDVETAGDIVHIDNNLHTDKMEQLQRFQAQQICATKNEAGKAFEYTPELIFEILQALQVIRNKFEKDKKHNIRLNTSIKHEYDYKVSIHTSSLDISYFATSRMSIQPLQTMLTYHNILNAWNC